MTGRAGVGLRLAVITALTALVPLAGAPPVSAARDLLPDLRMAPVYGLRTERTDSGRVRLRFGTIVWNVGQGPLEVRAKDRVRRKMKTVSQWVLDSAGRKHGIAHPGLNAFYAGDGHDHWHIPNFVVVTLFPTPGSEPPPGSEVRRLRKIGFCLTDLVRVPLAFRPPNSAERVQYPVSGCGHKGWDRIRIGIAVGWGDDYKPYFAYQLVDVTKLAAGNYRLCASANWDGEWAEMSATNNSYWLDVQLDPAAATVSIVGRGETSCQPAFTGVL